MLSTLESALLYVHLGPHEWRVQQYLDSATAVLCRLQFPYFLEAYRTRICSWGSPRSTEMDANVNLPFLFRLGYRHSPVWVGFVPLPLILQHTR